MRSKTITRVLVFSMIFVFLITGCITVVTKPEVTPTPVNTTTADLTNVFLQTEDLPAGFHRYTEDEIKSMGWDLSSMLGSYGGGATLVKADAYGKDLTTLTAVNFLIDGIFYPLSQELMGKMDAVFSNSAKGTPAPNGSQVLPNLSGIGNGSIGMSFIVQGTNANLLMIRRNNALIVLLGMYPGDTSNFDLKAIGQKMDQYVLAKYMSQVALIPETKQSTLGALFPTQTPAVQPTVAPTATVQPALKEYTSKSNSFSVSYPADWNTTENLSSVTFNSTDKSEYISIVAVNTGTELDATSFTNFINANEAMSFAVNKNYKETKREIQPDNNGAMVSKTLDINQIPSQAATQYVKIGKVIYIKTYIASVSAASQWVDAFTQVDNTFKSNPAYAEDFIPYTTFSLPYHDPRNLFTINIPFSWTYKNSSTNAFTSVASISPDGHAAIIIQEEDLGHEVTRPVGDAEALRLIKLMFENTRIAHIETLKDDTKDGTIQWSWAPQNGLSQEVSLHKGIGNVFYMITFMIDKGFDFYQSTMNDFITNSYKVAQ